MNLIVTKAGPNKALRWPNPEEDRAQDAMELDIFLSIAPASKWVKIQVWIFIAENKLDATRKEATNLKALSATTACESLGTRAPIKFEAPDSSPPQWPFAGMGRCREAWWFRSG